MLRNGLMAMLLVAAGACATTGKPDAKAPQAEKPLAGKAYLRQEDLAGKEARVIDERLGVPALKRAEGKGEFRRYAFLSCSLIVILYPDDKGKVRVQHLDAAARVSGDPKPDLDQCLARGPAPVGTS